MSGRSILERWTALGLAVTHGWGGRGGSEKREELVEHVVKLHRHGAGMVDADDLMVAAQPLYPLPLYPLCLTPACFTSPSLSTLSATPCAPGALDAWHACGSAFASA